MGTPGFPGTPGPVGDRGLPGEKGKRDFSQSKNCKPYLFPKRSWEITKDTCLRKGLCKLVFL